MTSMTKKKLAPLYEFFEKSGTDRLSGLSESYFFDLGADEKEEAWKFLEDRFYMSSDCITGLYMLDSMRAVNLFKETVLLPIFSSPIPAEKKAMEENRLLMVKYINDVDPDPKYIEIMCEFASSEFYGVRAQFANSVPIYQVTRSAVNALKGIIFTELESIPLSAAITKLMVIHGMDFDRRDPVYKSIYLSLRSGDQKEKISGMKQLEMRQSPDYV